MSGKIIAFEGIDGIGKTTHLNATSIFLDKLNIEHIKTQELNGDDIRKEFRKLLMNDIDSIEELLIISAARRWHYHNIIEPALLNNKIVLLDRFIESTWAYQVGGRGVLTEIVEFLQAKVWSVPEPDLTICIHGKSHRKEKLDRFEKEDMEFFNKVNQMYLSRAKSSWILINSASSFDENQSIIESVIANRYLVAETI